MIFLFPKGTESWCFPVPWRVKFQPQNTRFGNDSIRFANLSPIHFQKQAATDGTKQDLNMGETHGFAGQIYNLILPYTNRKKCTVWKWFHRREILGTLPSSCSPNIITSYCPIQPFYNPYIGIICYKRLYDLFHYIQPIHTWHQL